MLYFVIVAIIVVACTSQLVPESYYCTLNDWESEQNRRKIWEHGVTTTINAIREEVKQSRIAADKNNKIFVFMRNDWKEMKTDMKLVQSELELLHGDIVSQNIAMTRQGEIVAKIPTTATHLLVGAVLGMISTIIVDAEKIKAIIRAINAGVEHL